MSIKKYLLLIATFIFSFFILTCMNADEATSKVVRASIDIGSGATNVRVAEVDLQSQKIVQVLESKSFPVPFQEELSKSNDGNFNRQVMDQGLLALKQAAEVAKKYQAQEVIAVATQAFRKAHNADAFIQEIHQKTGVKVYVIDQNLEGELAFQAVRAQFGYKASSLVVWDIGGGSFQLTTVNDQGDYDIYRGVEASVPLKNYVITQIKKADLKAISSPNPLNIAEILQSQFYTLRLAQKVDETIKDKIKDPQTQIVGVGKIFGYQIAEIAGGDTITQEQMVKAVADLAHKSDKEIGGEFSNVHVTNAILVLGFMEGLSIDSMQVVDINPADGAFFYSPFWKNVPLTLGTL